MENRITNQVFQVLGNAVTSQANTLPEDMDWSRVAQVLFENGIAECCYRYANSWLVKKAEYRSLFELWRRESAVTMIKQKEAERALLQVIKKAGEHGLRPIVFKGIILAQLYSVPSERAASDSDLLVKPDDVPAMHEVLLGLGYERSPQKENVQVYILEGKLTIELHTSLWEDYQGKMIKKLEQLQLTAPEKLIEIPVDGTNVLTLGKTEHLFYLMFHLIKHFSLEGIGMRYMLDVTLYVNTWGDEVDWKEFWTDCEQLGYGRFCRMYFTLCETHLGMRSVFDKSGFIMTEDEEQSLLDEFVHRQFRKSLNEQCTTYEALHVIEPYFCNRKKWKQTKLTQRLSFYFPLSFYSDARYRYANRCKLLLPVAWLQRAIDYRKKMKRIKEVTLKGKFEKVEQRIGMMKLTGLID